MFALTQHTGQIERAIREAVLDDLIDGPPQGLQAAVEVCGGG
jgi:hypothetical protein